MKKHKWIYITIISIIFLILVGSTYIFLNNEISLNEEITLEAGIKEIKLSNFYKNNKIRDNAEFITDINEIDLNVVGDYQIKIKDGNSEKTVMLHLIDTTKPEVEFKDIIKGITYKINPEDFIVSAKDVSELTYKVENEIVISDYGDYQVTVTVRDKYNNVTKKDCKLSISTLAPEYILELGDKLKKEDILFDEKYNKLVSDEDIKKINNSSVGEYEISMVNGDKTYVCKVIVQDTKVPELELKDVTAYINEKVGKEAFISSVKDASNDVILTLKSEIDTSKEQKQNILIEAADKYGNKITKTAVLTIKKDNDAPIFSGLGEIIVKKNQVIDYNKGVSATDKKDGKVDFTVDASKVNTAKFGNYYATYTAKDKSGNTATKKRKVTVKHDSTDLNNLIKEYAAKAGNNYESMRLYVQQTIKYTDSWGDNDSVWYGLTKLQGNCYVHATVYKAFLDKAGIENKLIWTTDKSHYWNLIKINGVWRHSDSTPGKRHSIISAETDEVRYANLQGRNWDRSAWPEAN